MTESDTAGKLAIANFDYDLPQAQIAQEPLVDRAASKLMVLGRSSGNISHRTFRNLPEFLQPGDLLVANDSRVIPARLKGFRSTGGAVEFLLLRPDIDGLWLALAKPVKRIQIGESIEVPSRSGESASRIVLREKRSEGQVLVELDSEMQEHLEIYGQVPLPPYITHQLDDDSRYQTVYANESGSAAAPTAGLHFTDEVISQVKARGVDFTSVTLHVGLDTFRPVAVDYAEDHEIHSEWCSVPTEAWEKIQAAKEKGGRVVAVGTTSARTLETLGQRVANGESGPFDAFTRIYITPGYEWTMVDAMLTNFHLPKSTLLLMISSFAGKDSVMSAYQSAIEHDYRFFSFGDAMFIQ